LFRSAKSGIAAALLLALAGLPGLAVAQEEKKEEKKLGWFDTAELSYVLTSGNSEGTTLGFKNKLWRVWDNGLLEFNAGGIRVESTTTTYSATGTPGNFDIDEDKDTSTTAENYYLNGRYDRKISDRFFWFVAAGWDRNEPAGVKNRYTGAGGVGNIWYARDDLKFRTDYALSWTKQDDVVENPDIEDSFFGLRLSWLYWNAFTETTSYTNEFIVDENLDETDDLRLNMINSLAVTMSKRLALKVSLQWLYDNQPALIAVPLNGSGPDVYLEADDLDTIFTTSLVVNF
jgi:hypothetical protein